MSVEPWNSDAVVIVDRIKARRPNIPCILVLMNSDDCWIV